MIIGSDQIFLMFYAEMSLCHVTSKQTFKYKISSNNIFCGLELDETLRKH